MGFTNTPTLETERLLLRRFSENDLYALFKIHSDKDLNTYLPWFPLQSIEEASLFLRERYWTPTGNLTVTSCDLFKK
mgnify:CR=1 FL=1